jgi:hypothetical protein
MRYVCADRTGWVHGRHCHERERCPPRPGSGLPYRLVLDAAGVFEQLGTRDGRRGHKLFGRSGSPSTGPPVYKPRAAGLAARYRFGRKAATGDRTGTSPRAARAGCAGWPMHGEAPTTGLLGAGLESDRALLRLLDALQRHRVEVGEVARLRFPFLV